MSRAGSAGGAAPAKKALPDHAFFAVTAASEHAARQPPAGLILMLNELRRLFIRLRTSPPHNLTAILRWPRWRRRHQAIARECHYDDAPEHNARELRLQYSLDRRVDERPP